jgi:arsenate reductase
MTKTRVLFLCTGNSARSQMAEAFLRRLGGDRFEAFSAGFQPREPHPMVMTVMAEKGYDLSGQYAKSVTKYMGKIHFGYLITLCRRANDLCPKTFPDISNRLHWEFPDPTEATGTEEERLEVFRSVRDDIETRIEEWLEGEPEES